MTTPEKDGAPNHSESPNSSPPEWAMTAAKKALGSDASRWDVDYVARAMQATRAGALCEAAELAGRNFYGRDTSPTLEEAILVLIEQEPPQ